MEIVNYILNYILDEIEADLVMYAERKINQLLVECWALDVDLRGRLRRT